MTRLLASALFLALASALLPAQFSQTLPPGFELADGSSSTAYPFGQTAMHRWHWIYDTTNFAANYPIVITQLGIRPNGGGSVAGGSFPNVEISFASATVDWAPTQSGTQTFDANMDVDQQIVYTGNVVFPAGVATNPAAWVLIPVTPFLYDPSIGKDFIIQVRTPGPGNFAALAALDVHLSTSGTRYGNLTSATAATSSFAQGSGYVPVVKIDYAPASGIYASFNATPTSGPAPLGVNFTDTSFTSDPGGILSWSWDFDGDNIIDSVVQNPGWIYPVPGQYTVSLTVTCAQFGQSTSTAPNYVSVAQYVFDASTAGGGNGNLTIQPVPLVGAPTMTQGFTFVSLAATTPVGAGPFMGITPDQVSWTILLMAPQVNNPFRYLVSPGAYPDIPYVLPPGTLSSLAGVTADFVQVGLDAGLGLALWSNVDRVTF